MTAAALPILDEIRRHFERHLPLRGSSVLLNMHLTRETAALAETLRGGGASIFFLASNRTAAPEDVTDRILACGTLCSGLRDAASEPRLFVIEGNGKVFRDAHEHADAWPSLAGISIHTSGGGALVDAFDPDDVRVPVVAVYRDRIKQDWETGLGTSQSVTAALLRGLARPVAGRNTLVIGFGNVGRGTARALRAVGARVRVAEIRDDARLQARFDGFEVTTIADGLRDSEVCLCTTGRLSIVTRRELAAARRDVVLTNVSNEPREIDLEGCTFGGPAGPWLDWWYVDGNRFLLLGGGIQVNHVVEGGNPEELMDLSFSLHALVVQWLADHHPPPAVHAVPGEIHASVARLYSRSLE